MHTAADLGAEKSVPLVLDFARPFVAQVQQYLDGLPDLRGTDTIVPAGQPVGAILTLAGLELACGLPTIGFIGFGKPGEPVTIAGSFDLADYRHNVVRPLRRNIPTGDEFSGWTVLDGAGRGITPVQLTELAASLGCAESDLRVADVSVGHVDPAHPEAGVADRMIATGLTKADWLGGRFVFLPPGLSSIAAVMAAAIYGIAEVWPRVARLDRSADGTFHVVEVCDTQDFRQFGAALGARWAAGTAPVAVPRDLFDEVFAALNGAAAGELRARLAALVAPRT